MHHFAPSNRLGEGPPWAWILLLGTLLAGCQSALPVAPPPLRDMEEPLDLFQEPKDESQRLALPPGCFSGIELAGAPASLDSAFQDPAAIAMPGLEIARVVENSPAARALLAAGDLLLEARYSTDQGDQVQELSWPSQWRAVELEAQPGAVVRLLLDRAGREARTELVLEARGVPAPRQTGERFREESYTGIAVRTATEVEAREAGLAPGAGAVLVGLSRSSPWRSVGLRFGDLITEVDGQPLAHPQALIQAIRERQGKGRLELSLRRPLDAPALSYAPAQSVKAPLTSRKTAVKEVSIPVLFQYQREGAGRYHWSMLLGSLGFERTQAAWRVKLLWLIRFGGGDTEALREVDG